MYSVSFQIIIAFPFEYRPSLFECEHLYVRFYLLNLNRLLLSCFSICYIVHGACGVIFCMGRANFLGSCFSKAGKFGSFLGRGVGKYSRKPPFQVLQASFYVAFFVFGWKIYDMTLGILGNLPTLPMEIHDSPENVRFTGLGENQQGITTFPLNFRVCYVPLVTHQRHYCSS